MNYFTTILSIISAIGVIVAIYTSVKKSKQDNESSRKERERELEIDTEKALKISTDMEYVKRRLDDSAVLQKQILDKIDNQGERITRLEESCKSAHRRLDSLENK